MSDDLDRLVKLAEAATPGPWSGGVCRAYRDEDGKRRGAGSVRREGGAVVFMSANGPEILEDDVKFIAAANPKVVRALVQRVRRLKNREMRANEQRDAVLAREAKVRELHKSRKLFADDWETCSCGYDGYPCPTIRALDADGKETNE